jgi:excisionase family DNA binding protein
MAAEAPKPATLTVEEVADRLCVTARTVRNWINDGVNGQKLAAVADGRGRKLAWTDALEFYVQMRIAKDGNSGNPEPPTGVETLEQAETRKTIADADLKELKLAQLRSQLVPAAEVGKNVARVAMAIKTKLDAMPNAMALRLVGKSDRVEVQQILQDEVYRIQLELSSAGSEPEPAPAIEIEDEE